jgi:hypothetical protein
MKARLAARCACPCSGGWERAFWNAALACAARMAALDDRLANRASHGRFFSAHLVQGTFLSQPVFALAQFWHAMGVRPATVGTPPGSGSVGSLASWYVVKCRCRRSLWFGHARSAVFILLFPPDNKLKEMGSTCLRAKDNWQAPQRCGLTLVSRWDESVSRSRQAAWAYSAPLTLGYMSFQVLLAGEALPTVGTVDGHFDGWSRTRFRA